MDKEKISYIILTWNSEKYIEDCLNSILQITNFTNDIIVIDNGSIDSTAKILKNNSKMHNNIKLKLLDKNLGTTRSRNLGLEMIDNNTNYICILDSDTIINQKAITIMIDYLKKDKDVGIVGPGMIGIDGQRQIPYRKFPTWKVKLYKAIPVKRINLKGEKLENYNTNDVTDAFKCDYLISACWIMRSDTYEVIGKLDEKIFYSPEDVEYCMRAREKGFEIIHLKNAEIIHYYQRISKKKLISKANITHLLGLFYVLNKYRRFLKEYRKEEI